MLEPCHGRNQRYHRCKRTRSIGRPLPNRCRSACALVGKCYLGNTMLSRSQPSVKYWEIIADNLSKAGWSWACGFSSDSRGMNNMGCCAHRGDGKRLVVHADEKLTAFVELAAATRER